MEINQIDYTLVNQFHMLRHFQDASDELIELLKHSGYTDAGIKTELTEPGSRFYKNFADNITSLLEKIFKYGFTEKTGANGNLVLTGKAYSNDFIGGVGSKSVVSIADLIESEKEKVFFKKNRDIKLMHLNVDELPTTFDYTIILKPINDRFIFITAFPGEPAMPLPDHKLESSLYEQCKQYWDNHVFLVEYNN
jgi:hypothetical protein